MSVELDCTLSSRNSCRIGIEHLGNKANSYCTAARRCVRIQIPPAKPVAWSCKCFKDAFKTVIRFATNPLPTRAPFRTLMSNPQFPWSLLIRRINNFFERLHYSALINIY
ncbi:hypothetical protein ebA2383 [Aromatoleum aromaticum EbN1]|uniref:Uncharacterized protein n=1 Tax=Aromatoleum aromaticum (strain DSM 19018 / LMG 30748 / EbN1) TaxID=76114 RepID=Q5P5G1_AROAE|nr:hypothetical protein ebA2383 [Aromatoleum aromaticum EbN1]